MQRQEDRRSCARRDARPAAAAPAGGGRLTAAAPSASRPHLMRGVCAARQGRQWQPGRTGEPVRGAEQAAGPRAARVGPGGLLRAAARAAAHVQRRRCAPRNLGVQDRVGLGHRVVAELWRRAAHGALAALLRACGRGARVTSTGPAGALMSVGMKSPEGASPELCPKTWSPACVAGAVPCRLAAGRGAAWHADGARAQRPRAAHGPLGAPAAHQPRPDEDGTPCVRGRARARAGNDLCGVIPAGVPAMTSANASIPGFPPCPGCAPRALPARACRPPAQRVPQAVDGGAAPPCEMRRCARRIRGHRMPGLRPAVVLADVARRAEAAQASSTLRAAGEQGEPSRQGLSTQGASADLHEVDAQRAPPDAA